MSRFGSLSGKKERKFYSAMANIKSVPYHKREKAERNARIKMFYKSGNYSYNTLAGMFSLSSDMVGEIVRKAKKKKPSIAS